MALDTNLVSYWKFDENTGTSVADSVASNNGTFTGTTGSQWNTGIINSGLVFNGTNNWVNIADDASLDFTTEVTISAWIYKANNNPNQPIVSKRTAFDGTGIPFELTTDGSNGLRGTVIGNGNYINISNTFSLNTWYHVAMTWNGTTLEMYLDGSSVGSSSVSGTITPNAHVLMIGTCEMSSEWFTGRIDEVGLWSRGLSAAEIDDLYNGGAGLQYPFSASVVSTTTGMLMGMGS